MSWRIDRLQAWDSLMNYLDDKDDVLWTTSVSEASGGRTYNGEPYYYPSRRYWRPHKICRSNSRYVFVNPPGNGAWQKGDPTERLERERLEADGFDYGPHHGTAGSTKYYTTAKKNTLADDD